MSNRSGRMREAEELIDLMVEKRVLKANLDGLELELHPSAFPHEQQQDIASESMNGKICPCGCSEDGHNQSSGMCYNGNHTEHDCNPPKGDMAMLAKSDEDIPF